MIFLTSMAIGLAAGLTRSAFSVAFVAVLICCAYGAALAVSAGPVSIGPLLLAIAGYNVGLFDLLVGALLVARLRAA